MASFSPSFAPSSMSSKRSSTGVLGHAAHRKQIARASSWLGRAADSATREDEAAESRRIARVLVVSMMLIVMLVLFSYLGMPLLPSHS